MSFVVQFSTNQIPSQLFSANFPSIPLVGEQIGFQPYFLQNDQTFIKTLNSRGFKSTGIVAERSWGYDDVNKIFVCHLLIEFNKL